MFLLYMVMFTRNGGCFHQLQPSDLGLSFEISESLARKLVEMFVSELQLKQAWSRRASTSSSPASQAAPPVLFPISDKPPLPLSISSKRGRAAPHLPRLRQAEPAAPPLLFPSFGKPSRAAPPLPHLRQAKPCRPSSSPSLAGQAAPPLPISARKGRAGPTA